MPIGVVDGAHLCVAHRDLPQDDPLLRQRRELREVPDVPREVVRIPPGIVRAAGLGAGEARVAVAELGEGQVEARTERAEEPRRTRCERVDLRVGRLLVQRVDGRAPEGQVKGEEHIRRICVAQLRDGPREARGVVRQSGQLGHPAASDDGRRRRRVVAVVMLHVAPEVGLDVKRDDRAGLRAGALEE